MVLEVKFISGTVLATCLLSSICEVSCSDCFRNFKCIICLCFHNDKNPNQTNSVDLRSMHCKRDGNLGLNGERGRLEEDTGLDFLN